MIGQVHNRTGHPDDEVRRLVLLGIADLHLPNVLIEVSDAPKGADMRGYTRKLELEEGDGNLIIVRLSADEEPDHRSSARGWKEQLIWLVAHEAAHVQMFRRGLALSESACDEHAHEALRFAREVLDG